MNKKIKFSFLSYLAIILTIILLDQMLKLYVYNYMFEGETKNIPFLSPFLQLTYKLNHGIITGYTPNLKNWKIYFLIAKIVTICSLIIFTYYEYKSQDGVCKNMIMIFSAFIVGGAISNIIDWVFYSKYLSFTYNYDNRQFFNGSVIDMLRFPLLEKIKIHIPVLGQINFVSPIFNIADCFITLGSIASFVIYIFLLNNAKKNYLTETCMSQQNMATKNEDKKICSDEEENTKNDNDIYNEDKDIKEYNENENNDINNNGNNNENENNDVNNNENNNENKNNNANENENDQYDTTQ